MGQAFSNLFNRKNDSTPNNNQTPENITQNSAEETKHQNLHDEVNEPQQPLYSGPGAELERNRTVYVNKRNGAQDAKFIPNNISGVNRINTYNRPITVSEGSSVRLRPIPDMNNNVNAPNNRRNPRNRPVGQGHGRTSTITNMAEITGTPVQNQTTPNTQNHYTPIDANTRQNNRTPSIQRDNTQQGNTQQQNNTRRPGNSM